MEGMTEAAEEILGMPVRLGFPIGVKGIVQLVQGPQYASGVGLVRYGAARLLEQEMAEDRQYESDVRVPTREADPSRSFFGWLRDAF